MGGWLEALADKYTNKERTFHNIATFHTTMHPYINSGDTLGGTISMSTATDLCKYIKYDVNMM